MENRNRGGNETVATTSGKIQERLQHIGESQGSVGGWPRDFEWAKGSATSFYATEDWAPEELLQSSSCL